MRPKNIEKTILLFLSAALAALMIAACGSTPATPTTAPPPTKAPEEVVAELAVADGETAYLVDTSASTLTWRGAKPIGDFHTGTLQISEGALVGNGDSFVSGTFTIDMTTLAESENTTQLENHLKSDDFFGVASYPTASLEIVSATATDGGYDVTANLTIKATTNEITFPAVVTIADGTVNASAEITFDRSQWDVRYGSGSFFSDLGNDLINDEIELSVEIVANR